MKKILLLTIVCCNALFLFANNYRVEIAVFEKSVPVDYFYEVEDVKLAVDVNDLFRYYLGDYTNMEEAETAQKALITKGYKYAKVVNLKAERANCSASCKTPLYIENIFFDFDRSNLRTKSRSDLEELATVMQENPTYKVELSAHTDAKGSLEYNTALSKRRSSKAKKYLVARGIRADRITTSEFGETSPIAINDANGQDSPSGRQFNRRVVVTLMNNNGTIIPNVVQPINVPSSLRAK